MFRQVAINIIIRRYPVMELVCLLEKSIEELVELYGEVQHQIDKMKNRNTPKNKQYMYDSCKIGEAIAAKVLLREYKETEIREIPHTEYLADLWLSNTRQQEIMIEVKTEGSKNNTGNVFIEKTSKGKKSQTIRVAEENKCLMAYLFVHKGDNFMMLFRLDKFIHIMEEYGREVGSAYGTVGQIVSFAECESMDGFIGKIPIVM